MSVPTVTARRPMSVICLATSSSRSTVRAASTRSAPASAQRRASVVPSAGPTPLMTTTLFSSRFCDISANHPLADQLLAQRDPRTPILIRNLVGLVVRQRRRDFVDVDDLHRRTVRLGQLAGHPLPPELQVALRMSERLDPVGDTGVRVRHDEPDLV